MNFNEPFNEEAWAAHLGEHFTKEDLYVSSEAIIKKKFNFVVSIKSSGTLFKNDADKLVPVYIGA